MTAARSQRVRSFCLRRLRSLGILLLMLVVTACGGSSLDARYAVPANAAVQGQGQLRDGDAGGPVATATNAPGAVPGAAQVPGSRSPVSAHGPISATATAAVAGPATGRPGVDRTSCAGFRNQTGITDDTVTIANVSDLTGPVPGIFSSAQQAVRAYVAYFNATADLCGRELEVLGLDSRTDSLGDRIGYEKACRESFAVVGSMAAFDSGGAGTAAGCGIPDLRSQAVSDARNACGTCFGTQATELHAFQNAVPDFFLTHHRAATQKAAMIYVNEAASVENATNMMRSEEKRGMRFVYSAAFDVAEFNYSPYVQRMKQAGVRMVQFVGSSDQAVRLARAMSEGRFTPEVFLLDPTAYDPIFSGAGRVVDGAYVFVNFAPFEESDRNAELRLYRQWLRQVAPNAAPSYFGLFAWSAARLFVEKAAGLGGRLTRAALVAELRRVHAWTGNGLHAPQDVGGKKNGNCWRFLRLRDGRWSPAGGTAYLCRGKTVLPE